MLAASAAFLSKPAARTWTPEGEGAAIGNIAYGLSRGCRSGACETGTLAVRRPGRSNDVRLNPGLEEAVTSYLLDRLRNGAARSYFQITALATLDQAFRGPHAVPARAQDHSVERGGKRPQAHPWIRKAVVDGGNYPINVKQLVNGAHCGMHRIFHRKHRVLRQLHELP